MKISHGYEHTNHEATPNPPWGLKLVCDTFILMVSVIIQMPPRGMSKTVQEENTCHLIECGKK